MDAIIRLRDGGFYCSAVFGCYCDKNKNYYIVLNKDKTTLIRQSIYDTERSSEFEQMVIIFNGEQPDWIIYDDENCGVNFLTKEDALEIVNKGGITSELLAKCRELDSLVSLKMWYDVNTKQDIENLLLATGCFHDARIESLTTMPDGAVNVLFDEIWGCNIEVCFRGDVSYCTDSRDPEEWDPYWYNCSIIMDDGYIILVDEEGISVDSINDGYCWFKAKSMSYKIVPNVYIKK